MPGKEVKSRTTNWSKKKLFLFSIVSILLALFILEIIFRTLFFFNYRQLHTSVSIQGGTLQQADSELIFKNTPFYVDYDKKFQNNEEGMKSAVGDELIAKKGPRDFWVLLTGGSAMEGMGSNQNGEWRDITGVDDHPYQETIAFYLQAMLQQKFQDKKVKVFNAASSSYTIYQSFHRYLTLEQKIKPDWVISMDGINDPPVLSEGQTSIKESWKEWYSRPQFDFPLKLVIPLTTHSTFVNAIKQKIFQIKHEGRLYRAIKDSFPSRKKWASNQTSPIQFSIPNADVDRAVQSFSDWIITYDSVLENRNQKHLLLIQPHMAFRDTSQLGFAEKAVNHYYRSFFFANSQKHLFLRSLYDKFSPAKSTHQKIVVMQGVHHWPGWVFVDYCHFTNDAAKRISQEICNYIVSDGRGPIFNNKPIE